MICKDTKIISIGKIKMNALMCECVNALVGLIVMVEGGELWNRKGMLRDRRRIAEGLSGYGLKISNLLFV